VCSSDLPEASLDRSPVVLAPAVPPEISDEATVVVGIPD
jgi:hypothetical protein